MKKNEIWVDAKGYEGLYKVSNLGNIASYDREVSNGTGSWLRKGRMIKQHMNNKGYLKVVLSVDGNKRAIFAHRLVAENFIKNEGNLPFVNHIDCNPLNNKVDNLEWITNIGNIRHAMKNGRFDESFAMTNEKFKKDRESKMRAVIGTCVKTGTKVYYNSIQEAGRNFKGRAGDICKVCKGERKTAQGYRWEYNTKGV